MVRPKRDTVFTEAAGKTVKSITYAENADSQALEIVFSDGTLLSFEFSACVTVEASYLRARKGNLKLIRNFGRVSGNFAARPEGSNPHHNDRYSEVEVPKVHARITFSFEFTDLEPDVRKFEVTKVESIH
jgi:hypothetical protein